MLEINPTLPTNDKRRTFGEHLTSIEIFKTFILPEIKDSLYKYVWVDLFCGKGNLILPILDLIPLNERIDFFKHHIFLFDIQENMIHQAIKNAKTYGIPKEIAKNNIQLKDTLLNYPDFSSLQYPVYHITNPPYLYVGYIAKHYKTHLQYFSGKNQGYQDLYQIALMNDLKHGLEKLIYIIPSNFLFGFSVSNKIRKDFLLHYNIKNAIIFEKKIFEFTGTNVGIFFFEKKSTPSTEPISFKAKKIHHKIIHKHYKLFYKNSYRAGGEFDEFVSMFQSPTPLKIKFYLTLKDLEQNQGNIPLTFLNVNHFSNGAYQILNYNVNHTLYNKIKKNPLVLRTLDTGNWEGRAGLYDVKETFNVDGVLVTKEKYRTHPIQIFITPELNTEDLYLLKDYFNVMLEYFRKKTDSEFMTTYKYSHAEYIRKYLGLSQAKQLLETFPLSILKSEDKYKLKTFIDKNDIKGIKELILQYHKK